VGGGTENYQSTEHFSNINKKPNSLSKYFINTSDIDPDTYFPNLSIEEERMLFGYSKKESLNIGGQIYPKIMFKPRKLEKRLEERLGAAFKHAKKLEATFHKRNRKIPRKIILHQTLILLHVSGLRNLTKSIILQDFMQQEVVNITLRN